MKRSALLAMFALVTLGAPAVVVAAPGPAADSKSAIPSAVVVPPAFAEAVRNVTNLTGLALRDQLDAVATSGDFWVGYRDLMLALADQPQARQEVDGFMRDGAPHLLSIPGVPQHVLGRVYAATAAVGRIAAVGESEAPRDGKISGALKQAAHAFDALGAQIDERLNDADLPVVIRRMERRALRGLVAAMVVDGSSASVDDAQRTELLSIYAEGMENLVYLVAADLDGDAAMEADAIIRDLRLPALDRLAIQQRTADLQRARQALESTAQHLDGEPLRLPPHPGFRSSSNA